MNILTFSKFFIASFLIFGGFFDIHPLRLMATARGLFYSNPIYQDIEDKDLSTNDISLEKLRQMDSCQKEDSIKLNIAELGRKIDKKKEKCLIDSKIAAKNQKARLKLDYNTFFQYNFDNREFDYSKGRYTNSMTIHAVRFTPSIGLSVSQGKRLRHRVLIGIDVLRNMGEKPLTNVPAAGEEEKDPTLNNWKLFKEITIFYHFTAKLNKWKMTAVAGIFPRYYSQANYGREMISDSLYFYDNNMEGLLLKFSSPKSYHEISCDWLSLYGKHRKEAFIVSTYSESNIKDYFKLGFKSRMHHSACSAHVSEVIDNLLFVPFVGFDLAKFVFLSNLSFEVQWHQGLQNRRWNDGLVFPCGLQLVSDVKHWNVGLNNTLFYGTNMLPFYNKVDAINQKYGADLYHQSPFYRVRAFSGAEPSDYDWKKFALYDRLELYYRPQIASFIDINLSFVFFFNEKFSGWQQNISLIFCLDKLKNKKKLKWNRGI